MLAAAIQADDTQLTAERRARGADRTCSRAHDPASDLSLVERIPFTVGGKIDRRVVAGQLAGRRRRFG